MVIGFGPLARYELARWWRTRYWIAHLALWTLLFNGILAAVLWGTPDGPNPSGLSVDRVAEAARGLTVIFGILAPLGVLAAVQGVIVGERLDGGLGWVLSLPVSRTAVLLAKALAHSVGLLTTMLVAQGVGVFFLIEARVGDAIRPPELVLAMVLFGIHLLFYLSLGLLLGTVVPTRGWVIAVGSLVLVAQEAGIGALGSAGVLIPSAIGKQLVQPILQGQPIGSIVPVLASLLWTIACLSGAIWRLDHQDL